MLESKKLTCYKNSILQLLYPRKCPVCGKIINAERIILRGNTDNCNPYICSSCYEKLNIVSGARCMKCSRPLEDNTAEYCTDCISRIRHFDQGIALLIHDDVSKKILYGLKYSNKRDNADVLAYEAARRLADIIAYWDPDVIVPVPVHKKRELERGYNQAEVLARKFVGFLKNDGIEYKLDPRLLRRNKQTVAQKKLGNEQRQENLKNAFEVNERVLEYCEYKSILLIDDIYTSGATLSECAGALKNAGIEKVYFLTFSIG